MNDKNCHTYSKSEKESIVRNLIEIFEKNLAINDNARRFIGNWILSNGQQKRKVYYDIWGEVLNTYLPKTRPVLFRSSPRIYKNDRISSFTTSLNCADKFASKKGYLIVCDTEEYLKYQEEIYKFKGYYQKSFYPIFELLVKAKENGGWGFSDRFFSRMHYLGEEEYIMKTSFEEMSIYKYCKKHSNY